jgi:hypothetical protein
MWGDARWDSQLKEAVEAGAGLRDQCGAYAKLNDAIAQALPDDGIWCAILPPAACGAAVCSALTVR